jgi:tetratricopeptide (TPR) repeat protein
MLPGSPQVTEEPGKIIPRRHHDRASLFGIGGAGPEPPGSVPSWIWLLVGAAALGIAVFAAISITTSKPPLSIPGASREQTSTADSLIHVLERDSLDVLANIELGNVLYDTQHFDEAVRYYRRALGVHPDLPDVRVDMAVSLHQSGRTPEALGELQQVIAAHPEHTVARLDMGIIYESLGRLAEAESTYKAVESLPLTSELRQVVTQRLQALEARKKAGAAASSMPPSPATP